MLAYLTLPRPGEPYPNNSRLAPADLVGVRLSHPGVAHLAERSHDPAEIVDSVIEALCDRDEEEWDQHEAVWNVFDKTWEIRKENTSSMVSQSVLCSRYCCAVTFRKMYWRATNHSYDARCWP